MTSSIRKTAPWLLAFFAFAGSAHAQSDKEARSVAIQLFDSGRKLAQAGKYSEACPKFEQSEKLVPGLGTEFNLADCYEHIGRVASAWLGFREVAAGAQAAGQSDRELEAKRRASLLEPKLSRIKLVVASPAPSDLEVTRDGKPIGKALWGTAIPIDAGQHVIVATAHGKAKWESTVTVDTPGTQSIAVPALESITAIDPDAAIAPHQDGDPPLDSTTDSAPRSWQVPLGVAFTGVGVAGLVVGVVTALKAKSGNSDSFADGHCNGNACDETGTDLRNKALTMGNIATVGFIAGAAFTAGGVALIVMAPKASKDTSTGKLGIGILPGGISAQGSW